MKKFQHLVYAGTFDRLHAGHKKLLDMAYNLGEKVSLAITTEQLYQTKFLSDQILPWKMRKMEVENYLRKKVVLDRSVFFKLDNIFGSSITDSTMDAILVTELTKKNAEKINQIRADRRLKPLKIIVGKLVRGDDGEIISSERIRLGEIDREGHNYQYPIFNNHNKELKLPDEMREDLRKPLGKVITGSVNQLLETAGKVFRSINPLRRSSSEASRSKPRPTIVIAVGDIITDSLLKAGYDPDIKIIDLRSRRQKVTATVNSNNLNKKIFVNKPGTINSKTSLEIKDSIKRFLISKENQLVVVEGEEDLLALPAILFAPLNSVVLYGQFDIGVVMVEVTEEKKKEIEKIISDFE